MNFYICSLHELGTFYEDFSKSLHILKNSKWQEKIVNGKLLRDICSSINLFNNFPLACTLKGEQALQNAIKMCFTN